MLNTNESNPVKVVLVQPDLVWEDIQSNISLIKSMILPYKGNKAVFILPELFTTGFTMNSGEFALSMEGKVLSSLKDIAVEMDGVIAGSTIIRESGNLFNRFLWIEPDGTVYSYDKRHLFRMGEEDKHYRAGDKRIIIPYNNFNFLPQICYDLRFPVFTRNRNDYDVIIYVANWPENRQHVWETLLKARAIENQCYVIGVNRTGTDSNGISYRGGSCVITPTGHLTGWLDNNPGTLITSLSLSSLYEFRQNFPVWKDADSFELN